MALRIIPGKKLFGTPPGGWNDTEPQTGIRCHGDDFATLVQAEYDILKLNQKPIPSDLGKQIEARFVAKLPDDWIEDPDARPNAQKAFRPNVIVMQSVVNKRTQKIIDAWNAAGRPKLDRALAEARASQCFKCRKHAPMGCLTCNGTYQHLQQRMGADLAVANDKHLQACGVDQVFLKVSVWLPDEVMLRLLPRIGVLKTEHFPHDCWKRRIMEAANAERGSSMAEQVPVTRQEVAGSTPAPASSPVPEPASEIGEPPNVAAALGTWADKPVTILHRHGSAPMDAPAQAKTVKEPKKRRCRKCK